MELKFEIQLRKLIKGIIKSDYHSSRSKAIIRFETSWTRTLFISIITYGTLFGYMSAIKVEKPWLNAVGSDKYMIFR